MARDYVVLTNAQRGEILRAATAIERRIKAAVDASERKTLFVVLTNLTIIREALAERHQQN